MSMPWSTVRCLLGVDGCWEGWLSNGSHPEVYRCPDVSLKGDGANLHAVEQGKRLGPHRHVEITSDPEVILPDAAYLSIGMEYAGSGKPVRDLRSTPGRACA